MESFRSPFGILPVIVPASLRGDTTVNICNSLSRTAGRKQKMFQLTKIVLSYLIVTSMASYFDHNSQNTFFWALLNFYFLESDSDLADRWWWDSTGLHSFPPGNSCPLVWWRGTPCTQDKVVNYLLEQRVLNDFIDDLAFSLLYHFGFSPTPFPLFRQYSKLDRRHTGRLRKRDNLLTRAMRGVRE